MKSSTKRTRLRSSEGWRTCCSTLQHGWAEHCSPRWCFIHVTAKLHGQTHPVSVLGVGTSQALQVSSNYRELEKKYGAITSMLSSQNQFIARLEKQCQCRDSTHQPSVVGNHLWSACCKFVLDLYTGTEVAVLFLSWSDQVMTEPPKIQSNVHPNYSSEASEMTNDVQRDQSAPPPQQEKIERVHNLPSTNTPTAPPFISSPATKTPGTHKSNVSFSRSAWWDSNLCISAPIFCQSYLTAQISSRGRWSQWPAGRSPISLGMPKQCPKQLLSEQRGIYNKNTCMEHSTCWSYRRHCKPKLAQLECLKWQSRGFEPSLRQDRRDKVCDSTSPNRSDERRFTLPHLAYVRVEQKHFQALSLEAFRYVYIFSVQIPMCISSLWHETLNMSWKKIPQQGTDKHSDDGTKTTDQIPKLPVTGTSLFPNYSFWFWSVWK